jgi:hypothetical protein
MVTVAYLFISTPGFAHGTDHHVLGTVLAIDTKHIEVKTTKGSVDVQINKKTLYKSKNSPKGASIPEVGDRVIIKAIKGDKKNDTVLLATEVNFSSAKHAPGPTPPVPIQQGD